jgi:hypothetical protein
MELQEKGNRHFLEEGFSKGFEVVNLPNQGVSVFVGGHRQLFWASWSEYIGMKGLEDELGVHHPHLRILILHIKYLQSLRWDEIVITVHEQYDILLPTQLIDPEVDIT